MSELFLVGTPIGNLDDISQRALTTLSEVDFIIAEDTRVSSKLLAHFDIKKPLVSSHKYSESRKSDSIINRILSGETAALITDAGMPCISDPGEIMARKCIDAGIEVVAIPGPVAAITALAISGLPTDKFIFEGFLPQNKSQRRKRLQELADLNCTIIFYEAPHRFLECIADLKDIMGNRQASVSRELTKMYEQTIRGNLEYICSYFTENPPKGEIVITLDGAKPNEEQADIKELAKNALKLSQTGMKLSEACKISSKNTSFSKSDVYNYLIKHMEENHEQ